MNRQITRLFIVLLFCLVSLRNQDTIFAITTFYSDETAFLADLASTGYATATDGFEDDNFWGLLEPATTTTAPGVTSQGVTWTGLGGGVDVIHSPAQTGDWALRTSPIGSPSDGFVATAEANLFGVGGWFIVGNSGSGGQNDVTATINGSMTDGFGVPGDYVFWGVIDTDGITSLQFETEPVEPPEPGSGDPIDPSKTFYLDNFTYGFSAAPPLREPGIHWSNAAGGNYSTGSNWTGGIVPAITENALFHLGSVAPYSVQFTQNETASQAVVSNDNVHFDLSGNQFTLTQTNITRESLIVAERPGDNAELLVTNGTINGANVVVAHSTNSTGQLTLGTNAIVALSGAMRVGSGGNGTLNINNGARLTSANGVVGQLDGTGVVNMEGTDTQWTLSGFSGRFDVGLGGNGTLNVTSGAAITGALLNVGLKAGNGLENESNGTGIVHFDGAGTTIAIRTINVAEDGPGTMNVTNGAQITGSGAVIAHHADGNVTLDGPGTSWTMNIGGSSHGTLIVGAGDQIGTFASTPPPPLFTGTMTIQNGATVTAEQTFVGHTRKGRGILTVTGVGSTWNSGSQFSGNTFIGYLGQGELNILNGASANTGQAFIGRFGLRDQLEGIATVDGIGSTWNSPSTIWVGFNNDPQVYIGAHLFFAEGTLNVTNGGHVTANQLALAGRKVSKGVVNVSGAGSVISANQVSFGRHYSTATFTYGSNAEMNITNDGLLEVTGNIDIRHGRLNLEQGTVNATNLILRGQNLSSPGSQFETGDTEVLLLGSGQINANVENKGGTIHPGGILNTGVLRITGDYTQDTNTGVNEHNAIFAIELGGTDNSNPMDMQFDQLAIDGNATLGGTLEVSVLETGTGLFTPTHGDVFEILTTTNGITGEFSTEFLPALTGNLLWNINYEVNSVLLEVTSTQTPGDFDSDGDVDADDFLAWQSGYGISNGALLINGDANSDGDVDGADFLAWQTNYTDSNAILTATVPEPSTIALLIVLLSLVCLGKVPLAQQ